MDETKQGRLRERKADAHEKITLGGLVVKAGLRNETPALILGILLDGVRRSADPSVRAEMMTLGGKALR